MERTIEGSCWLMLSAPTPSIGATRSARAIARDEREHLQGAFGGRSRVLIETLETVGCHIVAIHARRR